MKSLSSAALGFAERLPEAAPRVLSLPVTLREPFVDVVGRFAQEPGTVALLSGGPLDSARYHILGVRPWLTLRESAGRLTVHSKDQRFEVELDPFEALDAVLARYRLQGDDALPLSAGLLGYLAYDLKDCLEELPRTSCDDLGLPRLFMVAPSVLLIEDRQARTTTMCTPLFQGDEAAGRSRLEAFRAELSAPVQRASGGGARVGSIRSGLSRDEYIAAIDSIRDYIVRGHVYQVNMSQRFSAPFSGDSFGLFADLFEANPAPFFAYVQGADHQILSTSPERFVKLEGRKVETRPIKGTRPRGQTPELDAALRQELQDSRKDDAELSMIVDLLRNDIGKACAANSVHVTEHRRIESYKNVHHSVSVVEGTLDEDQTVVDLLRATFPGGSITGCPKIRSMEVIDELEPVRRHIYTGSIGYLGFGGTMDLSIAIRTATVADERLVFSVGGGVVYDSVAADEYEETLHKGRTLLHALGGGLASVRPAASPVVRVGYCDGKFLPLDAIQVAPDEEGFAYGYGIFETIRVQRGRPLRLAAHLARFQGSWEHWFHHPFPDITWGPVIEHLVQKNSLEDQVVAVKILATSGKPGHRPRLLVTARPYTHRLEGTGRKGLALAVYPHPWQSPLARHKTQNYMLQRRAAIWAKDQGADEALLVSADGAVAETNSANVLCSKGGQVFVPDAQYALQGTALQATCEVLTGFGMKTEARRLSVDDLRGADWVLMTNALVGAVPIARLNDTDLPVAEELCTRLRAALFEPNG